MVKEEKIKVFTIFVPGKSLKPVVLYYLKVKALATNQCFGAAKSTSFYKVSCCLRQCFGAVLCWGGSVPLIKENIILEFFKADYELSKILSNTCT